MAAPTGEFAGVVVETMRGREWDCRKIASESMQELEQIEGEFLDIALSEDEVLRHKSYIAKTRELLEALAEFEPSVRKA